MQTDKILNFFIKINDLQKTKRYEKYPIYRESVSEHVFKLILIINYMFDELKLKLDYKKCIETALYHDFGEMDMDSDIDAYESLEKELDKNEIENLKIIELSKYDKTIKTAYDEYENKKSPESRFVRACDKIEACIHVLSMDSEIMNYEFFATYSDKTIKDFPELLPLYREIKKLMKKKYIKFGYPWKDDYEI